MNACDTKASVIEAKHFSFFRGKKNKGKQKHFQCNTFSSVEMKRKVLKSLQTDEMEKIRCDEENKLFCAFEGQEE